MNEEQAKALRAPFDPAEIGKLPRLWCKACRDSTYKVCKDHTSAKCKECGQKHSTAALHLDYVGHAETTDRLLAVDPEWNWEGTGPDGIPVFDANGGMWIRLTIAGVTRLGYGDAQGKKGGDAIKECIGDAIRNGAMRFGVALDLWRKTDKVLAEHGAEIEPQRARPAEPQGKPPLVLPEDFAQIVKDCETAGDLSGLSDLGAMAKGAGDTKSVELVRAAWHRVNQAAKAKEAAEV